MINRNISHAEYSKSKADDLKESFWNNPPLPQDLPSKKICETIEDIVKKNLVSKYNLNS